MWAGVCVKKKKGSPLIGTACVEFCGNTKYAV